MFQRRDCRQGMHHFQHRLHGLVEHRKSVLFDSVARVICNAFYLLIVFRLSPLVSQGFPKSLNGESTQRYR